MKKIYTFTIVCLITLAGYSQNYIGLEHNGELKLYQQFNTAYNDAVSGDIMYLSGGNFSIGQFTIEKKLFIYGVGHYPDSSSATGATVLDGSLYINKGADSSIISGIYFTGNVQLGTNVTTTGADMIFLNRCSIDNLYLSYNYYADNAGSEGIVISENVIRGTLSGGYTASFIEKNIINGRVNYFTNATFENNVFLQQEHVGNCYCYSVFESAVTSCNFNGNIFKAQSNYWSTTCSGLTFTKNVFAGDVAFPNGTCTGTGNIINVSEDDIFTKVANHTFDYSQNYHLKADISTNYLGFNFAEVGLYGASLPYKDGAIPENPHIWRKQISSITSPDGKLPINIGVSAQDR